MDDELAGEVLRAMSQRTPAKLIQFGRALDSASVLVDGWPYFLEKPYKWASEYTAWADAGYPQDGDAGWSAFMDGIGSVAL